jgi:hypothetical protein
MLTRPVDLGVRGRTIETKRHSLTA